MILFIKNIFINCTNLKIHLINSEEIDKEKDDKPKVNRCFFNNHLKCLNTCSSNNQDFCWCATRIKAKPNYECMCMEDSECPDFPTI